MLGHGFNSETSQTKTMASSFDNNLSNDIFKPTPQISSNQSTSSENSLGKKVIH